MKIFNKIKSFMLTIFSLNDLNCVKPNPMNNAIKIE